MIITLPWPDKRLSPNARFHWRAKVGPKQAAKIRAGGETVAAKGFHDVRDALRTSEGFIPVTIRFYPPDRRHRDDDNMIASFKSARDGIADALGVDDRRFRPHYFFEDASKPGRIEVCISVDCMPAPSNSGDSHAKKGGPVEALTSSPALNNYEMEARDV